MSPLPRQSVNIVGAGLAGALLAITLARRGFAVTVYEKRADPRESEVESGRSINLALAARGIRALDHAGVIDSVWPIVIPLRGRMVHDPSGNTSLLPYGQREHEVIHSVGRTALNRLLIDAAAGYPNVTLRFGHTCLGADVREGRLQLRDERSGDTYSVSLAPTIATDGAGSAVRLSLAAAGHVTSREEFLDHDYKELTFPAAGGEFTMDPNALHIWPRGGFMLIALPNTDGSFNGILFLPREGESSFARLDSPRAVMEFCQREFPDAVPLIPDLTAQFESHPQGQLGTLHAEPWHVDGNVLLLGDAAHAIVPFHGQGANAAFEDCLALDGILDRCDDWAQAFAEFQRARRANAVAIAEMALENYVEMRDVVRDPRFQRLKALSLELERHFPERFIPRYSMVTFHPEISYSEAQRRGAVQSDILDVLDMRRDASGEIDMQLAERLIVERLSPLR